MLLYHAEKNLLETNVSGDLLDCLCFISGGNNSCGFVVPACCSASAIDHSGWRLWHHVAFIVLYFLNANECQLISWLPLNMLVVGFTVT